MAEKRKGGFHSGQDRGDGASTNTAEVFERIAKQSISGTPTAFDKLVQIPYWMRRLGKPPKSS